MATHDRSPDGPRAVRICLGRQRGRRVRLDPAFHAADDAAEAEAAPPTPEGGWLAELVRKAIRARTTDRRGSMRHPAVDQEVWVGWWTRDDFGAVQGRLIDISRGGAKITIPRRPPRRQPIWLYKEVDEALACVRGELVGLTPAPGGAYHVRLEFAAPCPTLLCEAVVCRPADTPRRRRREPKAPPFEPGRTP